MLSLEHVTKSFGETVALCEVSLELKRAEFLVLLGPTGAGKTTTLRVAAGLEAPDSGRVCFDGEDVTRMEPAARDVAFVFQHYCLYPRFRVYDNVAFPLRSRMRRVPKEEIKALVRSVTAKLGIDRLLDRLPSQLSGGEMQRVALARAIVRRPRLFLMDEPLSNLDAKLRERMRVELKRIQAEQRATTLYVTHDQTEAMSMADRLAVLHKGVIQQVGAPLEVYADPANTIVARLLGSPPMNLAPCRRLDSGLVDVGPGVLTAPLPRSAGEGTGLVFGVRPEDISLRRDPSPGAPVVEAFVVQSLGSQDIVSVRVGPQTWKIRAPKSLAAREREEFHMVVDMRKAHLFTGGPEDVDIEAKT